MKDNSQHQQKSRHVCAYCGKRRYEDRMKLVFYNPAIVGALPMWACVRGSARWRGDMEPICFKEVMKSLLLYNETGALHLVSVVQK